MRFHVRKAWLTVGLVCIGLTSANGKILTNGDFETGDLSGWTTFLTGTCPQLSSSVTQFDTANTGNPSFAAAIQVGDACVAGPGGGGIFQMIVLPSAGDLTVTADLARTVGAGCNADSGSFDLWFDGSSEQSFPSGTLCTGTQFLNFHATFAASAGSHDLRFTFERSFNQSVVQHIDNVALSGSATVSPAPEPAASALGFAGLALLAGYALNRPRSHRH